MSMELNSLLTPDSCEGLSVKEVQDMYRNYVNPAQVKLLGAFGFGRELVDRAEGAWIYTRSGRKILDFTSGIGVLNHGHNHPRILEVRRRFGKSKRMEVHKTFLSPYVAALSHNIAQLLPADLDYSYFQNSGSEAVEGAVKMAYKYHRGRRDCILHADIAFHGKLLGAGSLTGSPEVGFDFPGIPNTAEFAFGDIQSFERKISDLRKADGASNVYAVIVEPFSASCMIPSSGDFLASVREICTREKIILIFDEVYTGWGRTGRLFYFMRFDLLPDILVTSKSLGGGKASIAGYTARRAVFSRAYGRVRDANLHSTTYNGFGEETVTAIEAINIVVEEDFCGKAESIGRWMRPRLTELRAKYPEMIASIRGEGALLGIVFKSKPDLASKLVKQMGSKLMEDEQLLQKVVTGAVVSDLYEQSDILTFFGQNKDVPLQITPPLVAERSELEYFLSGVDKTLAKGFPRLLAEFAAGRFFPGILTALSPWRG